MSRMQLFTRSSRRLFRFFDYCIAFLLLLLLIEVCAIILTRQAGLSWVWLYDVTRWTLAWLVFFGAIPLTGRGEHLTVDIAAAALPKKIRLFGRALSGAATCAVGVLIFYYGGLEVLRMYDFGERSMSGSLPAYLGYSVLPVAFGFLIIAGLFYLLTAVYGLLKAKE